MRGGDRSSGGAFVDHRRRAAERLRREVMGADGSLGHPYFRALHRQLRDYERDATVDEVAIAAANAGLVLVGDFHALPAHQRRAADLLEAVASLRPALALGVEFVYTRQQRWLDRRQRGLLTDDEFLARIHYRDEWGYPWEGYRALLDRARALGVPVHALDAPPRRGFGGSARRDTHAARRIAAIVRSDPRRGLFVLFGEAHLAHSHLPRKVEAALGREGLKRETTVVFQSPDRIFWRRIDAEEPPPEVVRIDRSTWAFLYPGPLEKYEAYRQVLERWRADLPTDEEIDLTPAVHHLIDALLRAIDVRAAARRVRHRAGWSEDLADAFPEVYSGAEAERLLEPILAEHARSGPEIREARSRLRRRGALYDSRSNVVFVRRYLPAAAAAEGARFVRAALTGRLFIAGDDFAGDPAASTYGAAYGEALSVLGAKLVDPTGGAVDLAETGRGARVAGAAAERWVVVHRRFERSRSRTLPPELRAALRRSRSLRRRVALDVGRRLGARLVARVREGSLEGRSLRRLFSDPLDPGDVVEKVLGLLREP